MRFGLLVKLLGSKRFTSSRAGEPAGSLKHPNSTEVPFILYIYSQIYFPILWSGAKSKEAGGRDRKQGLGKVTKGGH